MERVALDQSGALRSLYDGCRDTICGKLHDEFRITFDRCEERPTCSLTAGHTAKSQKLLRMIDIKRELRLSIYLKIIPTCGIASLINYPAAIDADTRFLHFYYKTHRESCQDDLDQSHIKSLAKTSATHMITKIDWGMNVIIVLQLPSQQASEFDDLLGKISHSLLNDQSPMDMSAGETDLCGRITSTKVYANIDELTKLTKLEDVYTRIQKLKKIPNEHQRLNYTLCPLYLQRNRKNQKFVEIDASITEALEFYLLQRLNELKRLRFQLDHQLPDLLEGQLERQLKDAHQHLAKINELHDEQLQQIRQLVLKMRKGEDIADSTEMLMKLYEETQITKSIRKLLDMLKELETKGNFIKSLLKKKFEYCNVVELGIQKDYNDQLIEDILRGNDLRKVVVCATDELRLKDQDKWNGYCTQLTEKCKKNPDLRCVYADFTYSEYTLKRMKVIEAKEITPNNGRSSPSSSEKKSERAEPPSSSSTRECVNILLLGESGVGKSTFVNAFANYLRFQTLDKAQRGEPIVIIPTSFVMTINDNFDERVIKFGEADPNENHNGFGQSVTQQCKSYVFDISKEKKLRIIDTPGFGDTRGSEQDDLNMEEIFSFLNNFTYLNGICLLFKPEVNELNPYFRSCCTQLFDYFGEGVRDHFIFCFTKARSTFFAPGNIRPFLNTFFESFPVKHIPFEKANSFCFDSESFRYLLAIRNSITFGEDDRNEFQNSWFKSVAESKRFRDFLTEKDPYRRNKKWRSIKDIQFQINCMIRPMLEAVRNLLRNMILHKDNSSIRLIATPAGPSSIICYSCKRKSPQHVGQIRILPDHWLRSTDKCFSKERIPTEYKLSYEFVEDYIDEQPDDLKEDLKYLAEACEQLSNFLKQHSSTAEEDRFRDYLDNMMDEERFICGNQRSTDSNKKLIKELRFFKRNYTEHRNTIKSDSEELDLSRIYALIKSVSKISTVQTQLNAIREYHHLLVENDQRIVRSNEDPRS